MRFSKPAPVFVTKLLSRRAVGIFLALSITALMLTIFFAVIGAGSTQTSLTTQPDYAHLVRMTLFQAGLTTFFSLIVGTALAWSLDRLRFFGRKIVISLFATAIVAPGLVVAFGVIAVWGRAGWINSLLEIFSLGWSGSIFGLHGILIAHTILNGAFSSTILLARLAAIPAQKLKIGQNLALSPLRRFMVLDWPALSSALPALGSVIFLLAFTSFPIVLLLGGGPANQTIEVAIYASVRLNFDLFAAVQLALLQLLICLVIIVPALISTPNLVAAGPALQTIWPETPTVRLAQVLIVVLALVGFGLPLISVIIGGFGRGFISTLSQSRFWLASATSLTIAFASAFLTLVLALGLALARNTIVSKPGRAILTIPAYAYLSVPALVLSLGFFLFIRRLNIAPSSAAPFILILANALLALPFAMSALAPSLSAIHQRYDKLSRSLNLSGFERWRLVEWPLMGRETGIVLALGFSFSLGDLGVIALFGTSEFSTLPWLMFRALGAYRTNDAATIAAVLLLISLGVFWILPDLVKRWSNAQN